MCGIAALCPDPRHPVDGNDLVRRLVDAQSHRGPDDSGAASVADDGSGGRCHLGHARLSILDPSPAGHQPMQDPATGNWIVLNGEIYNHRELRTRLGAPPGGWRSGSDTETLLQAYRAWGEGCLDELRGMFAFAFWDASNRRLWCVRDRLGIKPLYYADTEKGCVVASEVRAILAAGWHARGIEPIALAAYMRFGCVPEPLTGVEGIHALPAGHAMTIRGGHVEGLRRWWAPRAVEATQGARSTQALRTLLERSVEDHLQSDVGVAVFLSGGVDSSVLASIAAGRHGSGLPALTLSWPDAGLDEAAEASAVARRHRMDHRVIRLGDEEAAGLALRAVDAQDLPSIDGVNTFLVSTASRRAGFKAAISGLGGDELFGGYPSFHRIARAVRWGSFLRLLPEWTMRALLGRGRSARAKELVRPGACLAERYDTSRALWATDELARAGIEGNAPSLISEADRPVWGISVDRAELAGYMRSMLLRDGDVLGMANSVEIRVPFLDHRVVEWALSTSASRSGKGKRVLVDATRDLLPPEVLDRPKRGFVVPLYRWMAGSLRPFVDEGLEAVRASNLLDSGFVDRVTAGDHGGPSKASRLWHLVVLGHWLRRRSLPGRLAA